MKKSKCKTCEKYSPKDFLKAFEELSKKMGYGLNYSPKFFKQDNGTFSMRIIATVISLSRQNRSNNI